MLYSSVGKAESQGKGEAWQVYERHVGGTLFSACYSGSQNKHSKGDLIFCL
jgi:hypothetical protein